MVAANPTKTTAANAAAETCLSERPLLTVGEAEGELVVPEPEPELEVEPDPEPELEPEPPTDPVLVPEEPDAVVVTKPVFVEVPVEVPVAEEPEVVAVEISRSTPDSQL